MPGELLYKKGGGLGLYLSKIIIRRLSGSIFIDPDYTGGTRMIVILPLK
ncbi:ATP-binding protein [Alistipes montrealensis]|nr:ATP-binding protein [Alistipes montrealensis]